MTEARWEAADTMTGEMLVRQIRLQSSDEAMKSVADAALQSAYDAGHAAGVATMQPWKDAVIDATVVSWTYKKEYETDPRAAIHAALAWESQVALDPAVSEGAKALYEKGVAAGVAQERARMLEVITEMSAHYPELAAALRAETP